MIDLSKTTRASDAYHATPYLKVLVYGDSGSGKTTWAVRSPRPLVLLTEPQGKASIAAAAPDARLLEVGDLEHALQVMEAAMRLPLGTVEGQPCLVLADGAPIQTIVLDGLSDLHREAMDGMRKVGSDGKEMPDWGRIQASMSRLLDALRDLPCNVVCTALTNDDLDDRQQRRILPALYGQLKTGVGQYFNAVGYCEKVSAGGGIQHVIHWQRGSTYACKPAPRWPVRIVNTDEPGQTTLGSLLLYSWPDMPVASVPGDSLSMVIRSGEPVAEQSRTQTARPQRATRSNIRPQIAGAAPSPIPAQPQQEAGAVIATQAAISQTRVREPGDDDDKDDQDAGNVASEGQPQADSSQADVLPVAPAAHNGSGDSRKRPAPQQHPQQQRASRVQRPRR